MLPLLYSRSMLSHNQPVNRLMNTQLQPWKLSNEAKSGSLAHMRIFNQTQKLSIFCFMCHWMHFGFLCDRPTQRRALLCSRRKITCDVQDVLQKDASMYMFTSLAFMKSGKSKAIVWKKTTIHLVCFFHKPCGTCRKYFMINLLKTASRNLRLCLRFTLHTARATMEGLLKVYLCVRMAQLLSKIHLRFFVMEVNGEKIKDYEDFSQGLQVWNFFPQSRLLEVTSC